MSMAVLFPSIPYPLLAAELAVDVLFKATFLLSAAWLMTALLRRASAALRHAVWSIVLGCLLIMPLFPGWLPAWKVDLFSEALPPLLKAPLGAGEAAAQPQGVVLPPPSAQEQAAVEADLSASAGAAAPLAAADPGLSEEEHALFPLAAGAVLVWILGVLFVAGRLAAGMAQVAYLTSQARPFHDGTWSAAAALLARRLGIRRRVRVLCSGRVHVPMNWGLWRPVVLLPVEAAAWSAARRRVVLLHELAHIKRWDYLTHLVAQAACALYWFNPLVWVAAERMDAAQEQACDDRVLQLGTRSCDYAEHLVAIARSIQVRRAALQGAVAMAQTHALKDRIRAILNEQLNRRPLTLRAVLITAFVVACLAVPLTALQLWEDGQAETPPAGPAAPPVTRPAVTGALRDTAAATAQQGPTYVWLEAEKGRLQAPMQAHRDPDASGRSFVWVPDGSGHDAPDGGAGHVAFTFTLDRTDDYVIWGRVLAPNTNDNSFYVSLDGGREATWHVPGPRVDATAERWTWAPVSVRRGESDEQADVVLYGLEAGTHTLRVRNREDGTRLDRLLITNDPSYTPHGTGPAAETAEPFYLWLEAEEGRLHAAMQVREEDAASGRRFIMVPEDRGGAAGHAEYRFDVPHAGNYMVWGRILAPRHDANSFYVSVGGEEVRWDTPGPDARDVARSWTWDAVSARDEASGRLMDPLVFSLEAGTHTLRVRNRERGTRLDGLLITDDLAYRPRGRGALPPKEPVYVWLEAEDARLEPPLQVREDSTASGNHFIAVEKGKNSHNRPPREGHATFPFSVSTPGTYLVWGRVLASDDDRDSFWVRVNEGDWIRWNGIQQGKRWNWDEVHDADRDEQVVHFDLEAGLHILEVAYREDGTRLDRVLITNDPSYAPYGPGPAPKAVEVTFR